MVAAVHIWFHSAVWSGNYLPVHRNADISAFWRCDDGLPSMTAPRVMREEGRKELSKHEFFCAFRPSGAMLTNLTADNQPPSTQDTHGSWQVICNRDQDQSSPLGAPQTSFL